MSPPEKETVLRGQMRNEAQPDLAIELESQLPGNTKTAKVMRTKEIVGPIPELRSHERLFRRQTDKVNTARHNQRLLISATVQLAEVIVHNGLPAVPRAKTSAAR